MHPVFFQVGSFYIGTYGVLLALALIVGTLVALGRAKRVGVDPQVVMDLIFFGVLGGIVGGRVAHVILNFQDFLAHPFALLFSRTGFVFLGSLMGSIAVVVFILRRRNLNFWAIADVLVTAVPAGHVFGRLGCFTAGCCFGRPMAEEGFLGFLAVRFPKAVEIGNAYIGGQAFEEHRQMCLAGVDSAAGMLDLAATESLPVWPIQLFASFGNLLIFAALMLIWRRRRFNGQVLLSYLFLYSIMRFSIEFLRGDSGRGNIGFLTTSQWLTLLAFVFVLASWSHLNRTRNLEKAEISKRRKKKQNT